MIFSCKICGGQLDIKEGDKVTTCPYCGTVQSVPNSDDDKINRLYDRGNELMRNCQFDDAIDKFEEILSLRNDDPEIYWSLLMARFGISYEKDPYTGNMIPTIHRSQDTSIFFEEDYKLAISYANEELKVYYEKTAKIIDNIQKKYSAICEKEEPFDIFICYKQTDETTKKDTEDYKIAYDLYNTLTKEGYRVFFSHVTLEDKIGEEYEPYIYAALKSSKILLAIGTKQEYYNAVWVKNEWSRFMYMMKNDHSKRIIPICADTSILPLVLNRYQSIQTNNNIVWKEDLVRSLGKLSIKRDTQNSVITTVNKTEDNNNTIVDINSLIKRAYIFLEDKDFDSANKYAERILDINPEESEAYLIKLLVSLKVSNIEEIETLDTPFEDNKDYQNLLQYGNRETIGKINTQLEIVYDKKYKDKLDEIDNVLLNIDDISCIKETIECFENNEYFKIQSKISQLKDKLNKLQSLEDKYNKALSDYDLAVKDKNLELLGRCIDVLRELYNSNFKDSFSLLKRVKKDYYYYSLISEIEKETNNKNISKLINLEKDLNEYLDYKDGIKVQNKLKQTITELIIASQKVSYPISTYMQIISFINNNNEKSLDYIKDICKKKIYKKRCIRGIVAFVAICFIFYKYYLGPKMVYNNAIHYFESGDYEKAAKYFEKIDSYKDSTIYISQNRAYIDRLEDIVSFTLLFKNPSNIAFGDICTICLKSDGTVVATGNNDYGQCDVSDWSDIVSISCGYNHAVGLKSDGTVVVTGNNDYGQCDVSNWKDIVSISCGYYHTVGLKSDGTVVTAGLNNYNQCDVSDWSGIVSISCGYYHTIGLKSDGTVVATGRNYDGRCDVSNWKDIVSISCGLDYTTGLKSDGTVVATGNNDYGQCDVSDWSDIASISCGYHNTVGLKSDGTVVAIGNNAYGQCDVSDWSGIASIFCGKDHTVGLKTDNSLVFSFN